MATLRFAAIDVGSYEPEMVIYDISEKKGVRKVNHVRKVLSLGRESYRTKKLSAKTIDELCDILMGFREIMDEYGVEECRAYATSAIREATNRDIILNRIRIRTGFDIQVLSNSEQRYMFYKALAMRDNRFEELIREGTAIVDVGFGSLQISLFDQGGLVTTQNIRLGALRVREMLANVEGNNRSVNRLIEELVDNDIATFRKNFLGDVNIRHVICVGNNILYLVKRAIDEEYDGVEMISAVVFNRFYQELMKRSPIELAQALDIPEDYATLMIPGCMVYKRVLDITDAENLWAPNVCLCDGAAADFARSKHCITLHHDFENDIIQNAYVIGARYSADQAHTRCLDAMACVIFDSMKKIHGMSKRDRLLLRIACILHDVGKYVSMGVSGDCAYYIIMSTEVIGLSHLEREIVANVVRYNTTAFGMAPTPVSNPESEDMIRIQKLTAMLRVVNAMDRSHKQKFRNVTAKLKEKELYLITDSTADISLERGLFREKADFFEQVFGIRPILKKKGND